VALGEHHQPTAHLLDSLGERRVVASTLGVTIPGASSEGSSLVRVLTQVSDQLRTTDDRLGRLASQLPESMS
jgi:hypothetical protein